MLMGVTNKIRNQTMGSLSHRVVRANGIRVHIAEQGTGPLVLLLHGFPELWYSWRHQLPALAGAGYHAVAPDLRGYGRTDAPASVPSYSIECMTQDVSELLDRLGEDKAFIVGHDWGASIAWHLALLFPRRVRAIVALSVPFMSPPPIAPTEMLKRLFKDRFFYMLYFQEPGVAEAELETDVRRTMRLLFHATSGDGPGVAQFLHKPRDAKLLDGLSEPEQLPRWLTESDLSYYTREFRRTGFRGGLNRYRNMDADWLALSEYARARVEQPALFLTGDRDGMLAFTNRNTIKRRVPDLRGVIVLPGCGHWIQQERPDEVNSAIIEFFDGLYITRPGEMGDGTTQVTLGGAAATPVDAD
jgi:epoxide hydrolase A/B